jgi:quercetin dioxygenase-like cupin family protein
MHRTRPIFVFLLSCLAAAAASNAAQPGAAAKTPNPMIGSTVFNWDKLPAKVTPNGERRDVANNPTATLDTFECHITTLNPGKESHLPHRHPQEELILIKEGTLDVHINGVVQRAGPGSTLFYASNDAHNVRNVGDTRATYWVINLATSVTHTPAAHNSASTLKSGVFEWSKLPVKPSKVGEGRAVLNGSTVTLKNLESHITTVNAGEAPHAAHRHPDEELIVIREGTLEATINGQTQRAGPGSIFFFASNDLHGLRNVGTTRATYHVIRMVTAKTPPAQPVAK